MSIELRHSRAAAGLALALIATATQAHVTAEPREAPPASTQVVRFRVGHGCHETSATTALRIELPPGIATARGQPKAGWTLSTDHAADGSVTAMTWTGRLPGGQFDEFALLLRTPASAATLYFPVVQTCGPEEEQWTEIPDEGEDGHGLRHPAPALHITPAGPPETGHHP